MQNTNSLIKDLSNEFTLARNTAESAINQVPDSELIWKMDEKSNSIAILIKHIGGHLLSRFTDFLTTDGQKSFRNRALEFQNHPTNLPAVIPNFRVREKRIAQHHLSGQNHLENAAGENDGKTSNRKPEHKFRVEYVVEWHKWFI